MLKNEFGGFFSIFVNYESLHKFRIGYGKRSPRQSRIRSETDGHWHALVKKVMRKSEAHEINGKLTICLLFWGFTVYNASPPIPRVSEEASTNSVTG